MDPVKCVKCDAKMSPNDVTNRASGTEDKPVCADCGDKGSKEMSAVHDRVLFTARMGLPMNAPQETIAAQLDRDRMVLSALEIDSLDKGLKIRDELKELRAFKAEVEARDLEVEVDAVIAAHAIDPKMKRALLSQRRSDPKGFAEDYPIQSEHTKALKTNVTGGGATKTNSALGAVKLGANGGAVNAGAKPLSGTGAAADMVNKPWTFTDGRNEVEKAMNFLAAQPGGDKMSLEKRNEMACKMVKGELPLPTPA